jgi:hypothetical protein
MAKAGGVVVAPLATCQEKKLKAHGKDRNLIASFGPHGLADCAGFSVSG